MYLWRKQASRTWWSEYEAEFQLRFAENLAVIERPNRKRLLVEITCKTQSDLHGLLKRFGGKIEKLRAGWLKRTLANQKTKPIRVGNGSLIIPASAAFGTGEHATTAMSLHMLERLIRHSPQHHIVDLGTGSGILALAAKRLGAVRVIGIDLDPMAISVAEQNAHLNRIRSVQFKVADVRKWKFPARIDVITANMFSELLIEVVPKLKSARWLILSGILREQEASVVKALCRGKASVTDVRRRGKWVALLATGTGKR